MKNKEFKIKNVEKLILFLILVLGICPVGNLRFGQDIPNPFGIISNGICSVVFAQEEEQEVKKILIKVQPRIIALPENVEISQVPLLSARIRSIELRELCKQYNAVSIERVFKIKEEPKGNKTVEDPLVSKEKEKNKEKVDPAKVFTKDKRKEFLAQEQEVIEAKDTFLIQFELGEDVDMKKVASEYSALPEVLFAEYVELVGEEEK